MRQRSSGPHDFISNRAACKEARGRFLRFAVSGEALWAGNFRDFNAAIVRMATLAAGGRITLAIAEDEIARLAKQWASPQDPDCDDVLQQHLGRDGLKKLDPFDRVQLAEVIRICRSSRSLSEAGRRLFSISREQKEKPNDADRLRKYLARFGLEWQELQETDGPNPLGSR